MTQEALKMALEALENGDVPTPENAGKNLDAITAIKKALAQTQEPRNVRERWNVELDGNDLLVCFNDHEKGDKCQYERYSQQRTWVGLTDDEIDSYFEDQGWSPSKDYYPVIKAIEAKIKENNT